MRHVHQALTVFWQVITWDMVDKVVAKISARTDVEYAFVKPFSDGWLWGPGGGVSKSTSWTDP